MKNAISTQTLIFRTQTVDSGIKLFLPVGVGGGTTSISDGGKPVTMGVWGPFTITWPR